MLAICGFRTKPKKIESHVQPIADAGGDVTALWFNEERDTSGIEYYRVDKYSSNYINFIYMLFTAIIMAWRHDYDVIVSFSLIPYGVMALIAAKLSRTTVHLGIIGGDLDVHAHAWYGWIVRWLFRRYDIVTVAGESFERRVSDCGVPRDRIFTVLHPVSDVYHKIEPVDDPEYDILWLTAVSEVKDPLLFVGILSELRDRSVEFSAALVGSGSMDERVEAAIENEGLEEVVDVPGWTDNPEVYYRNAKVYVMTSRREMLPLSLVEAMLIGTASVVPAIGAIPNIIEDGKNGILLESRDVEEYADAIERLLSDDQYRSHLESNAQEVKSKVSYKAVADSWREIFESISTRKR